MRHKKRLNPGSWAYLAPSASSLETSRSPERVPWVREPEPQQHPIEIAIVYIDPGIRVEIGSLLDVGDISAAKNRLIDYVLAEHHSYEIRRAIEERREDGEYMNRRIRWLVLTPSFIGFFMLTCWLLSA